MRIYSEKLTIPGVVGTLEALIDRTDQPTQPYVSVCCHPHPQHAGTMTNKVIHTAARAMATIGIPSIRFNFRGVGASEGEYGHAEGEQHDLKAVVRWAREQFPERKLVLVGFSFGAYISAMQAKHLEPELLISIAPPVGRIDFANLQLPACPWLVVQGEQDELVDANKVIDWATELEIPPQIVRMPETSHFFHGKLVALRESIESFCVSQLNLSGALE